MQDTPRDDDTNGAGGPDPAAGTPTPPPESAATPTPPPESTTPPAPAPQPAAAPVPPAAPAASPVPPPQPAPAPAPVGPGGTKPLIARVRDILMQPKSEWEVIDREPATVQSILTSYVLILAAIGPIALLIGQQLFGISWFGLTWRPPIGYSIAQAVFTYIVSIAAVYVSALIIDALAPSFGGTKNQVQAFKAAAYSATPGWVAGILLIIPMLGLIAWIAGIYGIYLLYLGLGTVMKSPQDKTIGYTAVVIIVYFVVFIVLTMIVGAILAALFSASVMPTRISY